LREGKIFCKRKRYQVTFIFVKLTGSSPSPCGRVKFSARKFWEGVKKRCRVIFISGLTPLQILEELATSTGFSSPLEGSSR
jgi:hypothetical protein